MVGFNSLLHEDTYHKYKNCYLTTIKASLPANKNTVHESMTQSKKGARERVPKYMGVTYDLALQKMRCKSKARKGKLFSQDLFIHLGELLVMMAYFKAVRTFIDNCGLIFVNAELAGVVG